MWSWEDKLLKDVRDVPIVTKKNSSFQINIKTIWHYDISVRLHLKHPRFGWCFSSGYLFLIT